mgnify:CR=1 FL=1
MLAHIKQLFIKQLFADAHTETDEGTILDRSSLPSEFDDNCEILARHQFEQLSRKGLGIVVVTV